MGLGGLGRLIPSVLDSLVGGAGGVPDLPCTTPALPAPRLAKPTAHKLLTPCPLLHPLPAGHGAAAPHRCGQHALPCRPAGGHRRGQLAGEHGRAGWQPWGALRPQPLGQPGTPACTCTLLSTQLVEWQPPAQPLPNTPLRLPFLPLQMSSSPEAIALLSGSTSPLASSLPGVLLPDAAAVQAAVQAAAVQHQLSMFQVRAWELLSCCCCGRTRFAALFG